MSVAAIPVITIMATAILAIGAACLAIWVIVQRVRLKVEWGDGGSPDMAQAVRAHANFTEHVPMALLAIGAGELAGASRPLVIGMAGSLIAARLLSAYGLTRSLGPSLARQAGASITIAVVILAGVTALSLTVRALKF
jgi:uncharacterized protein